MKKKLNYLRFQQKLLTRMKEITIVLSVLIAQILCANNISAVVNEKNSTAQQIKIIGTVADATSGEALPGVSISIDGSSVGVISDLNGKYSIDIPNQDVTLVYTYVGYLAEKIAVQGKSQIDVKLIADIKTLEEVVVVGLGTQKKASLTSAISSIKGDEAFKDRGQANVLVSLQGEVPGLTVTRTSTRPGSENVAMKIRGDVSINGAGEPLIIIDGIPTSTDGLPGSDKNKRISAWDELNEMNPNDIESISVLKDASAAIYGARSANGVILVTTKRGKKGAAKITYNGLVSTTINGIQPPITSNSEFLDMFYAAQYRDAMALNPILTTKDDIMKVFNWWIFGTGSVLPGVDANGVTYSNDVLWGALRNGQSLTLNNSGKTLRYEPNQYLMDILYGQAVSRKHSVSISGGDDKFGYMASFGYTDAQSQLKVATDGEKKYNGRLNVDYQASKLLKLEAGFSYEKLDITTPSTDIGAGWYDPWFWPVYTPGGHFYDTFGNRNPIGGLVGGGQNKTGIITVRNTAKATLDLSSVIRGLSVYGTGGYRTTGKNIQTTLNKIQYYDGADVATTNRQSPGSLTEETNTWQNLTLGGFVNYDSKFNDVHHVTAMAGMTAEEEDYKKLFTGRYQGPIFDGTDLTDLETMATGTNNAANGGQWGWSLVSYVSRLQYAYKDKYLIEFLGRRDGSSKLVMEQRWKNFYSVSGGWIISEESFMKNLKFLDFLKVRYSYGKTGNVDGIGNYEAYPLMNAGTAYFGSTLASVPALTIAGMTSANRTWETIINHDAGLDFTFLKNRLSGTFDYFVKTNEGMFIDVTYPSLLGASAPKSNNGKLQTKGWEFSLNWRDKIGSLSYNIGGSLSDASTKIQNLTNNQNLPTPGKNQDYLIGKPRTAIYVYKTDGYFQTQADADAYYEKYYWTDATHTAVKSGNIIPAPAATGTNRLRSGARRLVDLDGDGAITTKDLNYEGDAAPHMIFGFKAGLEWKGIDFQAFFQGVGKQIILRSGQLYAPFITNYTLQNKTFMDKTWTEDNPNAEYSVISRDVNFNKWNYENRDVSVQKSQYIRLKTLVLGYTFPAVWTKKLTLSKVRIYFSGDDLWESTKIKDGYDPEFGEASNNSFPFSRLLSFGLDVTF